MEVLLLLLGEKSSALGFALAREKHTSTNYCLGFNYVLLPKVRHALPCIICVCEKQFSINGIVGI